MSSVGITKYVICLTKYTYHKLEDSTKLIKNLKGRICLISDFDFFNTIRILEQAKLSDTFHSIIFRKPANISDPNFIKKKVVNNFGITKRSRVVYIDSEVESIISANIIGWTTIFISEKINYEVKKHRSIGATSDVFFDLRFKNLNNAIKHLIFGSI
jgi:FMN phosphatase YigB (HAD superfamily)